VHDGQSVLGEPRTGLERSGAAGKDALVGSRGIDYYDDPAPNSLVPSVSVVVVNDAGEILLIRRTDNDNCAVPGGAIDLGESVAQLRSARRARSRGSSAQLPAPWGSTPTPST
jgi:hypothetical protein